MFDNQDLKNHLETKSAIKTQSAIITEWNMNYSDNVYMVGNYRYRPTDSGSSFYAITNTFSTLNTADYEGATDADVVVDGGYADSQSPQTFLSIKEKEKMLFSLEDCLGKFRPRSGINKARYFPGRFTHHTTISMAKRPRYYMADKNDKFKYWSSFRTENGIERGISKLNSVDGKKYIDDAAPFVVYNNSIPVNRIVIKMQTNVADQDANLGPFSNGLTTFADPLYGYSNQTTPVEWSIQGLKGSTWTNLISFDANSKRINDDPIILPDGYVEVAYGHIIPEQYKSIFVDAGELSSENMRPESSINGYAYLVKTSDSDIGRYYIWVNNKYEDFIPQYGWYFLEQNISRTTSFVTDMVSPPNYVVNNETKYREYDNIKGLRIVVKTMNKLDSSFDLIEMSPRLTADLSGKTKSASVTKVASDIGQTGLPVGQLLASTGKLDIFDYDEAFNQYNENSIISQYAQRNLQVKIYEIIADVEDPITGQLYDYYIPIKTLYSEGFPVSNNKDRSISLTLRDLFFYFESMTAPQLLIQNASVSYAVSAVLDSIGFTNYSFKRVDGETEPIIPFFYSGPDKTVAEILNQIAISTQSVMFFDEYNNFIMMSKNYFMPSETERATDLTLYGSKDSESVDIYSNSTTGNLSNIIDLSSQDTILYNDGKINYSSKYIQRSYGSIRQASLIDKDKTWIYKPVLLWEVAGTELTKAVNDDSGQQSNYSLSALALNSDLTDSIPVVVNGQIINNIMDFGESIYWISRYNGFFYANGEVIKYDAVQYSVSGTGNVWITNVQEYQDYFSKLPFNGKIYPTGLVRIYCQPKYEIDVNGNTVLKSGNVEKHGRGQFGTSIVYHNAGLSSDWSDDNNVRGITMDSKYILGTTLDVAVSTSEPLSVSTDNSFAKNTTRNGILKNFLSSATISESSANRLYATQAGTVQSSAFIMNGPSFSTDRTPIDFVSYVYKNLDPFQTDFKHFGTRTRIIGKINNNTNTVQTPAGSVSYYSVPGLTPAQSTVIGGASGGMSIMVNPNTHSGYYFEIAALTENNISNYSTGTQVNNVLFYKLVKSQSGNKTIPVKLWGGMSNIVVDDGTFVGQSRIVGEDIPTVYDLAIEYEDVGAMRRFFLYINDRLVARVEDQNPLKKYNNMALFVRGSARMMFENVYALANSYTENSAFSQITPVNSVFGAGNEVNMNDAFRKYAISGIIQSTYLSGINHNQPPKYNMYYEEFGTIMREAAYMNVRYDKAYPALYAKISPTFNRIKGYTVSGFMAGAYGAEFLIFNATDTVLNLDETSGNYLRIQGITFTQQSQHELTMDEFFSKKSDFSNPQFSGTVLAQSPTEANKEYLDIKNSKLTYGKKEFSIETPYIQNGDDANKLMEWLVSKITKPRKSVGVQVFSMPIIQLGDIVSIDYISNEGNREVSNTSRFVVYNIEYTKNNRGPTMKLYLSEVV